MCPQGTSDFGGDICAACNAGYSLHGTACRENVCACENGVGTTGAPLCPALRC